MEALFILWYQNDRMGWLPLTRESQVVMFRDAQDAAEEAEKLVSKKFEIFSSSHNRSMKGIRFGKELFWRLSDGRNKKIEYRKCGERW